MLNGNSVMVDENSRLLTAWRALDGYWSKNSWRTISIQMDGNCRVLAGRYFPGNQEAILVGFCSVKVPNEKYLPQGQGFKVSRLEQNIIGDGNIWIALNRLPAGNLEMFILMVEDLLNIVALNSNEAEEKVLEIFIGRIRAWQNFMTQDALDILSSQEELGLLGELMVFKEMIELGVSPEEALKSWQGPLDNVHDFVIGHGAIEVKTTLSSTKFLAKISSLQQLDNNLVKPIFLVRVNLSLSESGITLPECVDEILQKCESNILYKSHLESRLMSAGLFNSFRNAYTRRFVLDSLLGYLVADKFPRLTAGNVDIGITSAKYEIDFSLFSAETFPINKIIDELRSISWS